MNWITALWSGQSVAHAVLMLSLIAVCGLAFGNIKVRGVGLGIAGVLFAGLVFGHFGVKVNHDVMEFLRDFGLILFVYSIGLRVGPGFFSSLRDQGLKLNLLASAIVLLGAAITLAVVFVGRVPIEAAAGLFAGATTNTPSLAAAQSALGEFANTTAESAKLPGLGYAVTYPFGIIGIIVTMLLTKWVFRVDVTHENAASSTRSAAPPLTTRNVEVQNPNLDGVLLNQVPVVADASVVVSRVLHNGQVAVASPQTVLQQGDVLLGVGTKDELEHLQMVVGAPSLTDILAADSAIQTRRVVVTRDAVLSKTLGQIKALQDTDVTVTRLRRMEIELTARDDFRLQFGDSLLLVGHEDALQRVAQAVGNSTEELQQPRIAPLFLGIALGVLLGSVPLPLPGVPAGVKLGLAGGPLIVALCLSRIGRVGPLVFYLPKSANIVMREIGIVLFMACVGLKSGDRFVETLTHGAGFAWMGYGALITLLPLLLVAFVARVVAKLSFPGLCGLLAGSMTDPPALAFAGSINSSEEPSLSYATVYPLVMLLRVVVAQLLIVFFHH